MQVKIDFIREKLISLSTQPNAADGLKVLRLFMIEGLSTAADKRERLEWLLLARQLDMLLRATETKKAELHF